MDSFARNALRLSLAGAGVAVLGAGFVGQASAAEAPTDMLGSSVPDTSNVESGLSGASLPQTSDNTFSIAGTDLLSQAPTTATPTASTPSSDSLPSLGDTSLFQVPSVANIEAPGLS